MGFTPPTLDYAAAKPRSRLRKGTRRILLAVLILACLYATPIAWLYWGWKQEQPAREMVARVGGSIDGTESAGPALLTTIVPDRLVWIRERITRINLATTRATDDDLGALRRLSRLKGLFNPGPLVTDAGLMHLRGLTGLQELFLDYAQVTDAGLVHLNINRLTNLQVLSLGGTQISDAGLIHLSGLTKLRMLGLFDTRVRDAGLVHLKGLKSLQRLALFATPVTDEGVADLQKALPQCEIMR